MGLASELEASLREFTAAEPVEVRERGGRPVPFSDLSWEVRGAPEKPLLHLWSESYNVTRRVLAITDRSDTRLALAVERFGHAKPERLEFVRVQFERGFRQLTREEFCARLGRILAEQFPDENLESLAIAPDLEHSLSGNYARGILRRGTLYWALLAAPDGESSDTVENSLTFGLLWLERVRQKSLRGTLAGLRLILPKGCARGVAHRLAALNTQLGLDLYERDPVGETVQKLDPASVANLDSWLVPHRETQLLLDRARPALEALVSLSPKAITMHALVPSREVWLRFRGLPFAKWDDGRIYFGAGDLHEELTAASRPRLQRLLKDFELHRDSLNTNTRHRLYRAQPERWLESVLRENIALIDASLDPRFVYTQVFANAGGEHGIIDALGVTRTGRLAILELKASEHIHLPLQAANYWLRVRRHLEQGDFTRLGYFPGLELQSAPPLVYLVAPALRFHPATDALLRYLSPEVQVTRVGLAESWRCGVSVVMRQ